MCDALEETDKPTVGQIVTIDLSGLLLLWQVVLAVLALFALIVVLGYVNNAAFVVLDSVENWWANVND